MNNSLNETIGLLAFYEADTNERFSRTLSSDQELLELKQYRKNLFSEIKGSTTHSDVRTLLWVIMSYPSFCAKVIRAIEKNRSLDSIIEKTPIFIKKNKKIFIEKIKSRSINKGLDDFIIQSTKGITKKYVMSKKSRSSVDWIEEYDAQSSLEEILAFLIQFDYMFQRKILEYYSNEN